VSRVENRGGGRKEGKGREKRGKGIHHCHSSKSCRKTQRGSERRREEGEEERRGKGGERNNILLFHDPSSFSLTGRGVLAGGWGGRGGGKKGGGEKFVVYIAASTPGSPQPVGMKRSRFGR